MKNVEMFFNVLAKMNNLEAKKNQNKIRKTSIFIFKSGVGYSIYFGISNDLPKNISKIAKSSEQEFTKENYKKAFLPNTGIFLGTVSEQELNYILFVFNKKYSVTTGPFISDDDRVTSFHTSPETSTYASISISEENALQAMNEHIRGTKDNYFKLNTMTDKDRRETVNMSEIVSPQDYITMLDMIKYTKVENYLRKAYSLSYLEFMEYALKRRNTFSSNILGNNFKEFVTAEEFLRR